MKDTLKIALFLPILLMFFAVKGYCQEDQPIGSGELDNTPNGYWQLTDTKTEVRNAINGNVWTGSSGLHSDARIARRARKTRPIGCIEGHASIGQGRCCIVRIAFSGVRLFDFRSLEDFGSLRNARG